MLTTYKKNVLFSDSLKASVRVALSGVVLGMGLLVAPGCGDGSSDIKPPENPTPLPTEGDMKEMKAPKAPSSPKREM